MVDFNQGPGQNTLFCTITTGLNIDPNHGGSAQDYYNWFKGIIGEGAELVFESRTVMETHDVDVSGFLEGYNSTPRTAYEWMFGVAEYSSQWILESLHDAVNNAPLPSFMHPNDFEFGIDFNKSKNNGFTLYKNQNVNGSDVWIEHQEFYYSTKRPVMVDGDIGDVWFVSKDYNSSDTSTNIHNNFEIWFKPAFGWVLLQDYVEQLSTPGTFVIDDNDPGNSENSWWLDLTGIDVRYYIENSNMWSSNLNITISTNMPSLTANGDLWINVRNFTFEIYYYDGLQGKFVRVDISNQPVHDKVTQSIFNGDDGNNNYVIDCGVNAIYGCRLNNGGTSELKIRKNGVLIDAAVTCMDITGTDLDVVQVSPGEVLIEHQPITTLPEQPISPLPATDVGRVYTLEINNITELFYIDDVGNITQLTNNGMTASGINITPITFIAVSGQTVFTLPPTSIGVMTVKINGVDTTAWNYSSPSVTYFPGAGNYVIEPNDTVIVLYYST